MKKRVRPVYALCVSIILAACIAAGCMTAVRAYASESGGMPQFGNYFVSDYDSKAEAVKANQATNEQIVSEGTVLLKNEDYSLPVPLGSKISVFGKNADRMFRGTSMTGALTQEGYSVNPTLRSFYSDSSKSGDGFRSSSGSDGSMPSGKTTGETPVSMYTDDVTQSFDEYNDAAIVVISRSGGEGTDIPRTMQCKDVNATDADNFQYWGEDAVAVKGARNKDDHYLQLDQNETDMIKMVGEKFDKVIVILNTSSHFECGFLDDPGHYAYSPAIKAALWVGEPLTTLPVAGVISGRINPSGHLTDTFARDFKADPTWQNFGNQRVKEGNVYSNLTANNRYKKHYVYYKEGIYYGYYYYETRGLTEGDAAWTASGQAGDLAINGTTTEEWSNWYDAHVVFPFGHGLSYTSFDWEIVDAPTEPVALDPDGDIQITVKVTNTGTVAGKDVVMLFSSSPYFTGEIEKPAVRLAEFGKTDMLYPVSEAGEGKPNSQEITLTFAARDMASYDYSDANKNDFKGYELEAGTYDVYVSRNAHDRSDRLKVSYTLSQDERFETDEYSGQKIENRFDEVSNELTEGEGERYLSRADWTGTFPTASVSIDARQWIVDSLEEWYTVFPEDEGKPYYTENMPTQGAKYETPILLKDMFGLSYDDPKWEDFLDQLTVDQLTQIVTQGFLKSGIDIPELGIKQIINADTPMGWANVPGMSGAGFAKITVLAATFNCELAYALGKGMGEEALWGTGESGSNIPGWYAPAVNLHRSPFGGRTGEYYSEDGVLTGKLASQVVMGARTKGLYTYVKHFAINNQESQRMGVFTWANEQCMREQYFIPYEICVKEGKATGVMTAFNRIGATWAFGDYDLITGVLRGEWGFIGSVVTDCLWAAEYVNGDAMIRAGGSLALSNVATISYNVGTPTTVSLLRRSAKDVLYLHANSMAINEGDYPTTPKKMLGYSAEKLDIAIVGEPYSATVATAELNVKWYPDLDIANVTYALAPGFRLPDGLRLSSDGSISGTPEYSINNYQFKVIATYGDEQMTSDAFSLTVIDSSGSIVYAAQSDLGTINIGETADIDVGTAEIVLGDPSETSPVTVFYSLKSGCALPEGLSLSPEGRITGTPYSAAVNCKFTVVASAIGYYSQEAEFTLSVLGKITFSGGTLGDGRFGEAYVSKVDFATGADNVTYALKEGSKLPSGLELTSGGYIVGTPAETCTNATFTVVASAPLAESAEAEYSMSVGIALSPFLSSMLTDGKTGEAYYASVNNVMGASSPEYTLKNGSTLPEGLTLSTSGEITGTPLKSGMYTFTVTVSEDGAIGDEKEFTIYVSEPSNVVSAEVPASGNDDFVVLAAVSLALGAAGLLTGAAALIITAIRGKGRSGKN